MDINCSLELYTSYNFIQFHTISNSFPSPPAFPWTMPTRILKPPTPELDLNRCLKLPRIGWEMVKEKISLPTLHYLILSWSILYGISYLPYMVVLSFHEQKSSFHMGQLVLNPKNPRIFVAFFTFLLTFLLLVAGFFTTSHVKETLPVDVRYLHTEVLRFFVFFLSQY